jgi:hypothetical protein
MRGIEFELLWYDADVSEYKVICSNGPFCGSAKMYVEPDALSKAAEILSGFPSNSKDVRDLKLGTLDPNFAGGGIQMNFRCLDSVGHAAVLVTVRPEESRAPDEPLSVCLYVPIEAGAIDAFVAKAQSMNRSIGAKAYLQMADHTAEWVKRRFPYISE